MSLELTFSRFFGSAYIELESSPQGDESVSGRCVNPAFVWVVLIHVYSKTLNE